MEQPVSATVPCSSLEFPVKIAPGVFNATVGTVLHFDVTTTLVASDCPISNGTVTFTNPHGTVTVLTTTGSVAPGATVDWGTVDYTIAQADIGTNGAPAGFVLGKATTDGIATEPTGAQVEQSGQAQADVFVNQPSTDLTESANPTSGRAPLPVTFTYHEHNTGTDSFSSVTVSGSICGGATYVSGDTNSNSLLDPGETWNYTCTHTFTSGGTFTDNATANGTDDAIAAPGPTEHASASVTVANPATSLTESASPTIGRTPLPVTFTYHEQNTGDDPISGVTVSGSICGPATYVSGDSNSNSILDPGETWTYTCSHTFNAAGTFTDHATANGTDNVDQLAAPVENASASVTVAHPATMLTESANPTIGRTPLPVTFTYHEQNTGDDPISGVTVSGSICGTATYVSGDSNSNSILDPGETWTYTCSHTFNSAGSFTDHATATGTDNVDDQAAPEENASASVTVAHPATDLTESASPTSGRTPLPVTFTYHEQNTGDDPISGVTVTGSICGGATYVSGDSNSNSLLDPGETWTYTCSFTFSTAGSYTDHATATGTDTVDNLAAPDEHASASVTVNHPATMLTESASPTSGRLPLPVTFTYHEQNTGNDPISGVTVSGSICGSATYVSGDSNTNSILDPGETWTYTCSHTFNAVGSFTDNATATGTDTADDAAAPVENASASVQVNNPATSLTESASPTSGRAPLPVTFTYHEQNTGNDPISGVSVQGSICGTATYVSGDINTNSVLDPGETWTYTCTHTFNTAGTFTDNGTATGTDNADNAAAPEEFTSAGVTVNNPATSLTESASPTSGRAPLPVTFTYHEQNTGNDPISGVTVSGSICGTATYVSGDINTNSILDPGETWVYTCSYTFNTAGSYTDNATANGTDNADNNAAPVENASVGVQVNNPATSLTESASPTSGRAPLPVTFTYHEQNTGNDPISGVTVSGSICGTATYVSGDINTNSILDPGETWVYTCTHTFNAAGSYTDNATANGTDTADNNAAPVENASASVQVNNPSTSLTESASPNSGNAPLPVTFTYHETNNGNDPISGVTVSGSICGSATYVSGDINTNSILDPGETWVYTCTHTFTTVGTFTDNATANGTDNADNNAAPVENASASVTVTQNFASNFTPGFWKNHSAATTPLLPLYLGGYKVDTFAKAVTILNGMGCGSVGPLNCMAGMLLAAELNMAQGGSTCISSVVTAANNLLSSYSYAGLKTYNLSPTDKILAMVLHDQLSAYNIDGVPTC
jgi:hypothetical protein